MFYRTVIQVEVLSEEPLPDCGLDHIAYLITEGDYSGSATTVSEEQVDGPTMARLLRAQGSEPGFFWLTEEGEETESSRSF